MLQCNCKTLAADARRRAQLRRSVDGRELAAALRALRDRDTAAQRELAQALERRASGERQEGALPIRLHAAAQAAQHVRSLEPVSAALRESAVAAAEVADRVRPSPFCGTRTCF